MGKGKKRSRDKESDEKILKKLRRLEKKIKRKQSVDVSDLGKSVFFFFAIIFP